MALQLRRGHTSSFGKTLATSFAVLALVAQPLYGVISNQTASAAANGNIIVRAGSPQGWTNADTKSGGAQAFVANTTTPYGQGALSMTTTGSTDSKSRYSKYVNFVKLSDVKSGLAYSTKQVSASFSSGLPAFQLETYLYGTSGYTTLTYEPYVSEGNAAVKNNVWQSWDVSAGKFYSSKAVGSLKASQGSDTYTLDQIIAEFSNAAVYKVGVNVGSNNPNYTVFTDGVKFNGDVYDFEPAVPATPALISPHDGAIVNGSSLTNSWQAVAGADHYVYESYNNAGATSLRWHETVVSTSKTATNVADSVFWWRVKAVDASNIEGAWSPLWKVTIDNISPVKPQHESPSNDAVQSNNDFWFDWSDVSGAARYEIQNSKNSEVNTDGSFQNVQWTGDYQGIQPTESKAHSVGATGTWYWQVRAIDAAGNKSGWTTPWAVTLSQAPVVHLDSLGTTPLRDTVTVKGSITDDKNLSNYNLSLYDGSVDLSDGETHSSHRIAIAGSAWQTGSQPSDTISGKSYDVSRDLDTTKLDDGEYQIRLAARDSDGNRDEHSVAVIRITIDNTDPNVTLSDISDVTEGASTSVSGTVDDPSIDEIEVLVDGDSKGTRNVENGAFSFDLNLDKGSHTIVVKAQDTAGNEGSAEKSAFVKKDTSGDGNTDCTVNCGTDTEQPCTLNCNKPTSPDDEKKSGDKKDNEDDDADDLRQIFTQPLLLAANGDAVLGAEDDASDVSGLTGQDIKGTQDVKGAETTDQTGIAGLAWYWWLLILAAIASFIWWLVAWRRRHNAEN